MKKSILVVDDEELIREMIRDVLELEYCEIFLAANGLEAMNLIKSERIDCVISDIRMPVKSGLELAKDIQGISGAKPALFFITGFSDMSPEEALNLGARGVFIKPFLPQELVDKIKQELDL